MRTLFDLIRIISRFFRYEGGYYGRKGDMREQQQRRYEGRYEERHQRTHGGGQAGHKATKEGQQQTIVQQEDGQWQTAMPR